MTMVANRIVQSSARVPVGDVAPLLVVEVAP
jgi:hypothetical protein